MAEPDISGVEVIRADAFDGVPHGFLGRKGGVSPAPVWGLQVDFRGSDDPSAVEENRVRAVAAACPGRKLVTIDQVHSARSVCVDDSWNPEKHIAADAMVTAIPGLALAIVTADCAPVLLADSAAGVIGAAHAGWRGAQAGVLEAALDQMLQLGASPNNIAAVIGPCIAQESYEVGTDFSAQFSKDDARFFGAGQPGKQQFDLEAYVAQRLKNTGVGRVEALGLDTYAATDRFYSYRRSVHLKEPDFGRQFSMIALAN